MQREIKYSFKQWCEDNGHAEWLDLWDYELNGVRPEEVGYKSGRLWMFKCPRGLHESEGKRLHSLTEGRIILFCKKCRSFGQYLLDEFGPDAIGRYWSDKNTNNPFELSRGTKQEIWLKCTSSNHPDYKSQPMIFSGMGCRCPLCSNRRIVAGINDVATTHKDVARYFCNLVDAQKYSAMSGKKVEMKCPKCGTVQTKQIAHVSVHGFHCCACSDGISYPNKFLYEFLNQLKSKTLVSFEREKVFDWSRGVARDGRKLYDFYIHADRPIIIEAHGLQHYEDGFCSINGAKSLAEEQFNDVLKRNLALQNGIMPENYVVIDCRKSDVAWIKRSIMQSPLPVLLSFSEDDIEWAKCDQLAASNMICVVCDMWNNGMHNVKEIAVQLDLHFGTVTAYLQKGEKFGWTEYGHSKQRPICCLDNGMVFSRARVCSENSVKIFGVHLDQLSINAVARGARKSVGGFHFQYLTRDEYKLIKETEPHRVFDDEYLSKTA